MPRDPRPTRAQPQGEKGGLQKDPLQGLRRLETSTHYDWLGGAEELSSLGLCSQTRTPRGDETPSSAWAGGTHGPEWGARTRLSRKDGRSGFLVSMVIAGRLVLC